MPDISETINTAVLSVGGAGGVVALGLYLRRIFKGLSLEDAGNESAKNGLEVNDQVLKNMQFEVGRLAKRVSVLEKQVDELADKLANVRVVALDVYGLVVESNGMDVEAKARIIAHLKQIIQDS